MTVKKTQKDLGAALDSTEHALGDLESALDKNGEANVGSDGLPEGWHLVSIDDVTFKGEQRKPEDSEELIYVDIGSIDRNKKIISTPQQLLGKDAPSRARRIISKGDVLVSLTRPNLNAVALVPEKYDRQFASTGFEVLKPVGYDSRLLFSITKSKSFIDSISGTVQGALYPAAKSADVKSYKIPLPPLAEQTVIAQTLDTLLAQVENIKTRLDAIPKILKTFRQSVLAAGVNGKLTEEWRGVNECGEIEADIKEILEARSKLVSKRTMTPETHLESDEYEIPEAWKWVSLDSLASKIVDGVHHKPEYVAEGVPFMSVKDINGGKMSFNYCKYISEETHKEIHPRCNPEKGDLLITKSGTIGRTAIVDTDDVFDLFVSVALIKPASDKVNMKYIDIALCQWVNSIDISSRVVGTAIKNLHLRDMRVLAIPFAPIKEQKKIVHRVEEFLTFSDQIEQQVKNAQKRVDTLTQSILAKAFRGELTSQWRAENPGLIIGENSAQVLLITIQEEREKQKLKPKKKNSAKRAAQKSPIKKNTFSGGNGQLSAIEQLLKKYKALSAQEIFEYLSSGMTLLEVFSTIANLIKSKNVIELEKDGVKTYSLNI